MSAPLPVLLIFAHQDDEYLIAERIRYHIENGTPVYCAYLTNGQNRGTGVGVRDNESRAVLLDLGIPERCIAFIGSIAGISDGKLWNSLDDVLDRLTTVANSWAISAVERIYAMAWEGGHADHDAAHVITLAFAQRIGALDRVWSFPAYNGHGVPGRLFRVMSPILHTSKDDVRRISATRSLNTALICWRYPSQRSTWVGLFPEAFVKYVVMRRDLVQPVDPLTARERPHSGPLLYERMQRESYERIAPIRSAFLAKHLD